LVYGSLVDRSPPLRHRVTRPRGGRGRSSERLRYAPTGSTSLLVLRVVIGFVVVVHDRNCVGEHRVPYGLELGAFLCGPTSPMTRQIVQKAGESFGPVRRLVLAPPALGLRTRGVMK
jgi:hypothetical protein